MSTVAYPIAIGDALSGGVTTTVTAFSLSDSAGGVEKLAGPYQSVTVTPQASLYGPAIIPLVTPGSTVTFLLPVCVPKPITFSQLSGGVTVYTHCPNETIQPSLWNSRRTILINQLNRLAVLIQLINYVNNAIANDLYNEYNNIMNKLRQLPTVNVGDPVSHEHYNVIYDHISLANDVIYYYFDVLYGYSGALPPFIASIFGPVGYVLTRMFKKSSMDMLYSGDWNNLTNALYAIDQALQIIQNYLPLIIKLGNPGYTYPNGQQIPIAIQPSNYPGINEDLNNVYFFDSSGNKIPYWVEIDANNNNGTAVVWLKLTDTVINQLNNGSSTIMLLPTPSSVIDGVNYGINSAITGSLSTDNIGNIMDQGLIYSIWANTSSSGFPSGKSSFSDPLINASLDTQSVTITGDSTSITESLLSSLNVVKSLFTSTIPCTVSGSSYTKCGSSSCTSQGNMLFAWQSGYSCGTSAPVSGSNPWLAKAIGWIQSPQQSTMYVLVDDGVNVWLSLVGELGTDGVNWASNGNNIMNLWSGHSLLYGHEPTPFTSSIPFRTHRIELHYGNFFPPEDALWVWFSNTLNLYHAKFVPYGYMPSVSITRMTF
jgi:hypothetical protein